MKVEIGETFVFKNKKFKIKEGGYCSECSFSYERELESVSCYWLVSEGLIPECLDFKREDRKSVIFVEV